MCENNNVKIDVSLIPEHTKSYLAAATLEFIQRILSQPGVREAIDRKIKELNL